MKKELFRILTTVILISGSIFLISKLFYSQSNTRVEDDDVKHIIANQLQPPDEQTNYISVDPVYGQMINGNTPQRVHVYEAGDDIIPDLYEVYFFPDIITNGTKGHYEVYRTLGKDRVSGG